MTRARVEPSSLPASWFDRTDVPAIELGFRPAGDLDKIPELCDDAIEAVAQLAEFAKEAKRNLAEVKREAERRIEQKTSETERSLQPAGGSGDRPTW